MVVRKVAGVIAKGAGGRVAAHNGELRHLEGVIETRFGAVREVDHHANAVHFAHHAAAKFRQTAVLSAFALGIACQIVLVRARRVANVVVAVVAKRGVDDATAAKMLHIGQIGAESKGILDARHHTAQAGLLVGEQIGRRKRHARLRTSLYHII